MAVYEYITVTGVIVPDTSVILDEVVAEFQQTFGMDLVTTPNTPQGLLIVSETAARSAVAENNAALANQINPNVAGGVFLDAIMELTGSFRTPATPSTVTVNLAGVTGAIIPQGSQASDSVYNNVFQTTETVTLISGAATVVMTSVENGPIVATAGTLTQIISNVLGWEGVTNPDSALLGTVTQSDEQARFDRRVTLFAQGTSTAGAIISAVYQVPNVTSMFFLENVQPTTQVIQGVTMVPHSIYACVNGGLDLDVAEAIQSKKSAGASYNNGASLTPISQDVTVPFSGQVIDVLFDRPDVIEIGVAVSVIVVQPIQDPVTTVQQAILNYASGLVTGLSGLIVGADVSPWEVGGAITSQHPGIYVQNLQIKNLTTASPYQYTEIVITPFEIATIQQASIVVTVL
jgi:Baseplate J-like protein